MFPNGETITVNRPGSPTGTFDVNGNPIRATPSTITINGVGVAPMTGDESEEAFGSRSVNGYMLYLPYGADLRAFDTVTVRGVPGWQVESDARVQDWRSPFTGWVAGTVAAVRRAS